MTFGKADLCPFVYPALSPLFVAPNINSKTPKNMVK